MAAIPEAMEGMQLSQRFSGAAQQLQADMDALKMSLEHLDFGMQQIYSSCTVLYISEPLHFLSGHDIENNVSAFQARPVMPAHVICLYVHHRRCASSARGVYGSTANRRRHFWAS